MAKTVELKPIPYQPRVFHHFSRHNNLSTYSDPATKRIFLQTWKPIYIPPSVNDITFSVPVEMAYRPDSISYFFYETPLLAWVICHVNNIFHPWDRVNGIYAGIVLRIPEPSQIFTSIL